jgi:hypothetical protein
MEIIIYQDQDGLAVIHPAPGTTMEQLVEYVPAGAPYAAMLLEDLPEDRYFRDAWKLEAGQLAIDIEGAKEIQRNVWRKLRAPKLESLDLAFIRALEAGDAVAQADIAAQKTALRDVTETALPNDLEGIRNTVPQILL